MPCFLSGRGRGTTLELKCVHYHGGTWARMNRRTWIKTRQLLPDATSNRAVRRAESLEDSQRMGETICTSITDRGRMGGIDAESQACRARGGHWMGRWRPYNWLEWATHSNGRRRQADGAFECKRMAHSSLSGWCTEMASE